MPRLTIALCKWSGGWRDLYTIHHVNALARMLREYLKLPYKLVLMTDKQQEDAGAEVDEVLPVPTDPEGLKLLSKPNCFRRLRFFDPEYSAQFGTEWVSWLDLDTLIRADITDMIAHALDDPFGMWILRSRWSGRKLNERPYNGAFCMIRVGEHSHVWRDFHPIESPKAIAKVRHIGSDQCHIGLQVQGSPTFGPEHGCYFFGQYLKARKWAKTKPMEPARILNFAGTDKPWNKPVRFKARDIHEEYMRWMDAGQGSKAQPVSGQRQETPSARP